jgi:hypothetical protein
MGANMGAWFAVRLGRFCGPGGPMPGNRAGVCWTVWRTNGGVSICPAGRSNGAGFAVNPGALGTVPGRMGGPHAGAGRLHAGTMRHGRGV